MFGDASGQIVAIVPTLLLFKNSLLEGTSKHKHYIVMKKNVIAFIFCLVSLFSYSQVPFVSYQSVPLPEYGTSSNRSSNQYQRERPSYQQQQPIFQQQQQQQQPSYQATAGYYYDEYSRSTKRVKIKINSISAYGQPQVYLRGLYNSQLNSWSDCNIQASKVNSTFDGETTANNFEWKAQVANIGVIYFNN